MCHNVCSKNCPFSSSTFYYYYLFIFGCAGSSLLRGLSSLVSVSRGYSLVMVCRLLLEVTALAVERRLWVVRLQ